MDFIYDQLATGSKLRILTVIDTFSRFSPAVVPRFSFRAPDVIEVLDRVCGEVGYPASIRVDQGSEFVSRNVDLWEYMKGVTLDFSRKRGLKAALIISSFYWRGRLCRRRGAWRALPFARGYRSG